MRLSNAAPGLEETNVEFALVDKATGRLKRCRMYTGTMLCVQKDLVNFPFDVNSFVFKFCTLSDFTTFDEAMNGTVLKGKSYSIQKICNQGEGTWANVIWDGKLQEWDFHGISTRLYSDPPHPTAGYEQSFVVVCAHMSRKSKFYFWKAVIPLYFLIFLSTTTFSFEVSNLSDRNATISTYFLACFAMLYVVGDALPKVDFLTKIDMIIFLCIGSLLVIGMSSRVLFIMDRDWDMSEMAVTINLWTEIILYLFLIIANIFIFFPPCCRKSRLVRELQTLDGGSVVPQNHEFFGSKKNIKRQVRPSMIGKS